MSLHFSEYNNRSNIQAMARRMDRKVIKLEAAYGSERQTVYVKRNQDLIVRDLMEEVQHVFKIPIEELVIFHKGTNLGEYMHQTLENLGVENNHQIRVTRDPELPNRSPRSRNIIQQMPPNNGTMRPPPNYNAQQGMDPVSYLKEIAPQRVPDPTPYQVRVYNQQLQNKNQTHNDVIKLYVSFGSEREYLLVHGKKPLVIHDLKLELNKAFKIPTEQQCIVYKGFNLHEYLDDAPLEAFGLENNSQISLWPKSTRAQDDVRLPRGGTPPPQITADLFTPRTNQQGPQLTQRWQPPSELPTEVLKVEVQHGSDRHQIILRGQNKTLTVLDLQNEMERVTAVPVRDQRVFFKSQELHMTPFKTLKECDLENNNCVKLVGDPSKLRYSNYFGRLNPSMPSMDPNDPNMMPVKLNQQLNPGSNQNFKN